MTGGDPGHLTPPRTTNSGEQAPSAPPAEEQRRCARMAPQLGRRLCNGQ